jgi:endonuclease G
MNLIVTLEEQTITALSKARDESLRALAEAREDVYYNATQDEAARKIYYQGMVPAALTPTQMYQQLHEKLTTTHTTKLTYDNARLQYLYPRVDLQPDKMLKSIYSGDSFSPETIIAKDLEITAGIIRKTRQHYDNNTSLTSALFHDFVASLDAAATYNAEHVVPQSWFAKRNPMRADLHHLFTCESSCNEFRANIPYFDFPDFKTGSAQRCGKKDTDRFEPAQGRGPVARATLYFLLRYPKEVNNNAKEYTNDRIPMLLGWHNSEPVSQYELHRNAEIFKVQGNRNPLIDFPAWSGKINFLLGLG